MAQLWSDAADTFIKEADEELGTHYGKMNVKKFLTDPEKFADQPNIATDAAKMRDEVFAYMDSLVKGMSQDKKALDDALMKAESVTGQVAQNISMQAKQNKVPIIKPVVIERNTSDDQIIYIDSADAGVMTLIEKLASSALYIADNTTNYMNHKVGEWIFGGNKTYVIRAYVPQSPLILMQGVKTELAGLFDAAIALVTK